MHLLNDKSFSPHFLLIKLTRLRCSLGRGMEEKTEGIPPPSILALPPPSPGLLRRFTPVSQARTEVFKANTRKMCLRYL